MRNKILLGVVAVLTIILIVVVISVKETYFEPLPVSDGESPITIRLLDTSNNTISEINLEDYIVGVVAAEMPASFDMEALKAQAVAARTYAMYKKETRNLDYDLVIGVSDQAYQNNKQLLDKWGLSFFNYFLKVRDAVLETKNEILTYEGEVINAFYFAMSNGYTENSELVFQEDLPYLNSVPSTWEDESLNNYEVTSSMSKEEFCTSLGITCEQIEIKDIEKSNANRVLNITINNQAFEGTTVRQKLGLRSTDFEIEIVDNNVQITTKGYGHGVGMSQYGANGMAKDGYTYEEILKYYYQNTEIEQIDV